MSGNVYFNQLQDIKTLIGKKVDNQDLTKAEEDMLEKAGLLLGNENDKDMKAFYLGLSRYGATNAAERTSVFQELSKILEEISKIIDKNKNPEEYQKEVLSLLGNIVLNNNANELEDLVRVFQERVAELKTTGLKENNPKTKLENLLAKYMQYQEITKEDYSALLELLGPNNATILENSNGKIMFNYDNKMYTFITNQIVEEEAEGETSQTTIESLIKDFVSGNVTWKEFETKFKNLGYKLEENLNDSKKQSFDFTIKDNNGNSYHITLKNHHNEVKNGSTVANDITSISAEAIKNAGLEQYVNQYFDVSSTKTEGDKTTNLTYTLKNGVNIPGITTASSEEEIISALKDLAVPVTEQEVSDALTNLKKGDIDAINKLKNRAGVSITVDKKDDSNYTVTVKYGDNKTATENIQVDSSTPQALKDFLESKTQSNNDVKNVIKDFISGNLTWKEFETKIKNLDCKLKDNHNDSKKQIFDFVIEDNDGNSYHITLENHHNEVQNGSTVANDIHYVTSLDGIDEDLKPYYKPVYTLNGKTMAWDLVFPDGINSIEELRAKIQQEKQPKIDFINSINTEGIDITGEFDDFYDLKITLEQKNSSGKSILDQLKEQGISDSIIDAAMTKILQDISKYKTIKEALDALLGIIYDKLQDPNTKEELNDKEKEFLSKVNPENVLGKYTYKNTLKEKNTNTYELNKILTNLKESIKTALGDNVPSNFDDIFGVALNNILNAYQNQNSINVADAVDKFIIDVYNAAMKTKYPKAKEVESAVKAKSLDTLKNIEGVTVSVEKTSDGKYKVTVKYDKEYPSFEVDVKDPANLQNLIALGADIKDIDTGDEKLNKLISLQGSEYKEYSTFEAAIKDIKDDVEVTTKSTDDEWITLTITYKKDEKEYTVEVKIQNNTNNIIALDPVAQEFGINDTTVPGYSTNAEVKSNPIQIPNKATVEENAKTKIKELLNGIKSKLLAYIKSNYGYDITSTGDGNKYDEILDVILNNKSSKIYTLISTSCDETTYTFNTKEAINAFISDFKEYINNNSPAKVSYTSADLAKAGLSESLFNDRNLFNEDGTLNIPQINKTYANYVTKFGAITDLDGLKKAIDYCQTNTTFSTVASNTPTISNILNSAYPLGRNHEGNNEYHLEFGMDSNGNIVFESQETANFYKDFKDSVKQWLQEKVPEEIYKTLEPDLERYIQAAWITSYNTYNSSSMERPTVQTFLRTVLDNLKKVFNSIADKPEYKDIYIKGTTYGNDDFGKQISNWEWDNQQIDISKTDKQGNRYYASSDGAIHLIDETSEKQYEIAMKDALRLLINRYCPPLTQSTITNIFRQAQKNTLDNCKNGVPDAPRGTQENSEVRGGETMAAIDGQNWSGTIADGSTMHLQALIELTLYHFDKLLYKELSTNAPATTTPPTTQPTTPQTSDDTRSNSDDSTTAKADTMIKIVESNYNYNKTVSDKEQAEQIIDEFCKQNSFADFGTSTDIYEDIRDGFLNSLAFAPGRFNEVTLLNAFIEYVKSNYPEYCV